MPMASHLILCKYHYRNTVCDFGDKICPNFMKLLAKYTIDYAACMSKGVKPGYGQWFIYLVYQS